MQCANAISCSFWLSEIGDGALPPPKSLHVFTADSKAGPLKAIPSTVTVELPGDCEIVKPSPPGPPCGSGKLGAPCVRMHCESSNWGFDDGVAFGLGVPEEPHPASAAAQTKAASTERSPLLMSANTCTVAWFRRPDVTPP